MSEDLEEEPGAVSAALLKPYASVVVLRVIEIDSATAFRQLWKWLEKARKVQQSRTTMTVVASGIEGEGTEDGDAISEFDDVELLINRLTRQPSWMKETGVFDDIDHELTVALRDEDLIAVHAPQPVREALQRWLDKAPRPPFRRIPTAVLEDTLLRGESRNLWLRATRRPSTSRPNSKAIAGTDLKLALQPFEDSTFALSSARAQLEESPSRQYFRGAVGTTPQASQVWNRRTGTATEFFSGIKELLGVLREALIEGPSGESPIPYVSHRLSDLEGAAHAFDISVSTPDEISSEESEDSAKVEAAELLQSATLVVNGGDSSTNFDLDVSFNDSRVGTMRATVTADNGRARMGFGFKPLKSLPDRESATKVKDALTYTDLLTVYYATGHTVTGNSISRSRITPHSFPNWRFENFQGRRIKREKPGPPKSNWQTVHDFTGREDDKSLYGWVVEHFKSGWLTCDDGGGEVADFIHVSDEWVLSLIHVKGAGSDAPGRGVSSPAFEVVAGQAAKNVTFLESETLISHLESAPVERPASWIDGDRTDSRDDIIEALNNRDARSGQQVVIVQPHLKKSVYDRLYEERKNGAPESEEQLRLDRVENLLNSYRPAITSFGADLVVISSDE